ncbi:MAG: UDP-glucose 4-epimerase GalE [Clostridiales bacterium]|jgi:UDP-glucose 4-epimerase|nr:UDP-glucose 4-epimerase GalE [Clostridiales bacterium]
MTILVTGGAGYIGSHTCVELLENGYDVVVADNLCNSKREALERVKRITGQNLCFYETDVRDEAKMDEIFQKHNVECVIHFAGLKAVGESVAKPLAYYDNNLNTTLTLCRVMQKHGVKRFVFSSSATVYSAGNPMPLTESSSTGGCSNPYGWTKYMCEQILRDAAAAASAATASEGWSVLLLRYFNPIGAHESGLIGEDPLGIPNNLLPYIAQTAVGRRDKLPVYGNDYNTPDGTGVRDYLHVVDLAKGHVAAVKRAVQSPCVEAINLGTGEGVSVLQMIEAFKRVSGAAIPYEIKDRRPGDLAVCWAEPSKAVQWLGWRAQKTLDDMCADTWRWQKQNPNGYPL